MKFFSWLRKKPPEIGAGTLAKFFSPTRPQIRRTLSRSRRAHFTNLTKRDDIDQYFHSDVAQDIAHTQIQKASRSGLRRPIRPIRLIAWSGWGVGMAVFAGSLLANIPFPLGALVFQVLPGADRVGELRIVAPVSLMPDEEFTADIILSDLVDLSIEGVSATMSFNNKALEVTEITTEETNFTRYEDASYDNETGRVSIVADEKTGILKNELTVAHVHFRAKSFVNKTSLEILPGSYVYLTNDDIRVPEKLTAANINFLPEETEENSITAKKKLQPVVLDGEFDDWRDVINYDAANFHPAGIQITQKNLIEGVLSDDQDAEASFEVAEREGVVYIAWFAVDDEVLDGDTVTLVMNDQVVEIPIVKALAGEWQESNNLARAKKVEGGYNLEIAMPRDGVTPDRALSLNAEIEDIDSQDGARLRLYFQNGS